MEDEQNLNSQSEQAPLSNMLSALLSNPEMMEKIQAIAGQMSTASEPKEEAAQDSLPVSAPVAPTADGLASVLANPELMAKLPQMMTMLGPMLSAGGGLSGKPSNALPHKKSSEDCRNDLLLALKPFLSPERCRAVDTMLRISKLGNVIRQIK